MQEHSAFRDAEEPELNKTRNQVVDRMELAEYGEVNTLFLLHSASFIQVVKVYKKLDFVFFKSLFNYALE